MIDNFGFIPVSGGGGGGGVTPAALTRVNDTNVTLSLGGTPATALLQATSLTLGWSGTLAVARGGTGLSALGTGNQLIRVNAGATALEYFTPTYISGLTINTTPISSGTVGGVLFQGAGDVLQQSANLFWNNTDARLVLSAVATASGRLTILSPATTGLAIQVRNNADTFNLLTVNGNSTMSLVSVNNSIHFFDTGNAGSGYYMGSAATITGTNNYIQVSAGSVQIFNMPTGARTVFQFTNFPTGNLTIDNFADKFRVTHSTWSSFAIESANGCLALQDSNARRPTSGARCVLMVTNGIKSTDTQDTFQLIAKDITAGNAAPHFYTENGDEIKIYRETTAVGSATLASNLGTPITSTDTFDGYTLQQIVKGLRNFQQFA
jgi:hypothetical protein